MSVPPSPEPAAPFSRWGRLAQVLGSLLVLGLLLRQASPEGLAAAFARLDPRWLLLALPVKLVAVSLHELRLWICLRPWARLPFARVLGLGYTSGLLGTLLPLRGGDLVSGLLLWRECGVPAGISAAAVALASGPEIAVFGLILLLALLLQGAGWAAGVEALDLHALTRNLGLLTAAATLGVAFAVFALLRLERWRRGARPPEAPGAAGFALHAPLQAANLALAALQVLLFVAVNLLLFRALGLAPAQAWLAACLLQAGSSLTGAILPQGLGAGHAASSVFVMATFGIASSEALALAALVWAAHQGAVLLLGALPLWRRLGAIAALLRGRG